MKTLIYVLATPKSGTTRLANALRSIGIDAYHEVLPTTDICLKWMKKRFTSNPEMSINQATGLLKERISKFLDDKDENKDRNKDGNGYFADISHYFAPFYPVIDSMVKDGNLSGGSRSIHLTRSFYPHRVRSYGDFSITGPKINDNSLIDNSTIYQNTLEFSWTSDIKWEEWCRMSQFERLCRYWTMTNEYFLEGRRKIFHVEDFNIRWKEILEILYPEATEEQKKKFKDALYLDADIRKPEKMRYTLNVTKEEEEMYEQICGPTLKKLGYDI